MKAPTHATPEGTRRYQSRFMDRVAEGHFRALQDLIISSIGLGTYLGEFDPQTDELYRQAVILALRLGCNVIDSAINYRFQRSERAIGNALSDLFASGEFSRDEIVIATKGGFVPFNGGPPPNPSAYFYETFTKTGVAKASDVVAGCHCMTPSYLRHQLAASLKNLKLDCIDIYYLHNPETQLQEINHTEFRSRLAEAFSVLEEAVQKGQIQIYGTATWNGYRVSPQAREYLSLAEVVQVAQEVGGPDHHLKVLQLPYNLTMPEALVIQNQDLQGQTVSILKAAQALGITVMASASMAQGRLSQGLPVFIEEQLSGLATDSQRAIQFVRSTPGISVALVGMKQPVHVEENLATAKRPLARRDQLQKLFTR